MLLVLLSLLSKDLIYLLGTLPLALLLFKTSYFIIGSITSLRIKYTKGLFLKEKVIKLNKIEKVSKEDYPYNNNLRVLRDMLLVCKWIL
jgi:hypothetical protein